MTTTTPTLLEVRSVLVETLGIEEREDTIDASTPLFGGLPELDSLAVLELVSAIEDRFSITVDDGDFSGELFETLGTLAAFVEDKVRTSPSACACAGALRRTSSCPSPSHDLPSCQRSRFGHDSPSFRYGGWLSGKVTPRISGTPLNLPEALMYVHAHVPSTTSSCWCRTSKNGRG